MKIIGLCIQLVLLCLAVQAQQLQQITGTVRDMETGSAIAGATVRSLATAGSARTDAKGEFAIAVQTIHDTLAISAIGHRTGYIPCDPLRNGGRMDIELERNGLNIEEVEINTGYYTMPKERATGTFVHIDNRLLNRTAGPNILQRLNGLAPGLQFVNPNGTTAGDIRIRGLSTIESDETPLIVLDNFPYEGDINNIDPNDIESVTILQDAAAASIWGAKAGNGVIVLTSKAAKKDGTVRSSFHSNIRIGNRPDLFYNRNWLDAPTMMSIEKEKYGLDMYSFDDKVAVPYYAYLLKLREDDRLSQQDLELMEVQLGGNDIRREASRYLYRESVLKQIGVNISGGSAKYGFSIMGNLSDNIAEVRENRNSRLTLGIKNRFEPLSWLSLELGVNYVAHRSTSNGISYSDLSVLNLGISPYQQLIGEDGAPSAVLRDGLNWNYLAAAESNGLLDWYYRPLDEIHLQDHRNRNTELRNNLNVRIGILKGLSADMMYQYTLGKADGYSLYREDSYYVRDMVNRFTQTDGSRVIPHQAIFRTANPTDRSSHYARLNLRYQREFSQGHELSAFAGADLRGSRSEIFPGTVLYNYNEEYLTGSVLFDFTEYYPVRPSGVSNISGPSQSRQLLRNRDLSYFSNASYTFRKRYILSGSLRYDASNLFGVKTNRKGVPLWSLGSSWNLSQENFYPFGDLVEHLRIKYTYGVAGNINKRVTHFPVVSFGTSPVGLSYAGFRSFGNPSLKWERVSTSNIGIEWRMMESRISGNFDYYVKHGKDLIGDDFMDPTTGIIGEYKVNYADIKTKGWDLSVTSRNLTGNVGWNTTFIMSSVANKVTHFTAKEPTPISDYLGTRSIPIEGKSRDVIFAIPYDGLSDQGLPLIYMDGEQTTDYSNYYNKYLTYDMLRDVGVSIPRYYGSLRNSVRYKGFDVGILLTWKGRFVFHRTSMEPSGEFNNKYHEDYHQRWQKSGDEQWTEVPRKVLPSETALSGVNIIYRHSTSLVTNGSHIRLQDIVLGYDIPDRLLGRKLSGTRFYASFSNLGLLWKATDTPGDPDYRNGFPPEPFQMTFGLNINL